MAETVDVAVVGGGPAGAALAIMLARRGFATTLLERRAAPTWHASGVFSSPLTRGHLARVGLSAQEFATLQRPISALDLESIGGSRCRLEYRHGFACGFDRVALETVLLQRARDAGADVRQASAVRGVELPSSGSSQGRLAVSPTASGDHRGGSSNVGSLSARVIVGADGSSSLIARAAGVHRSHRWFRRAGITFHRHDPAALPDGEAMVGRFVFGRNWYMGLAPVPGARVNVGMVVPDLKGSKPAAKAQELIDTVGGPRAGWMDSATSDWAAAAGRLEHHVQHAAGDGWLLVGDAIGFIDPLSGEGLLRALVSAELAAEAIDQHLAGDPRAFAVYDHRIRGRFLGKNVVSWMLQLFLAQPPLFDYVLRRLERRRQLSRELTLVLADQRRASTVIDPRFIARLVAP